MVANKLLAWEQLVQRAQTKAQYLPTLAYKNYVPTHLPCPVCSPCHSGVSGRIIDKVIPASGTAVGRPRDRWCSGREGGAHTGTHTGLLSHCYSRLGEKGRGLSSVACVGVQAAAITAGTPARVWHYCCLRR